MKKYILIMISLLVLLFTSCDLGMVKLMDKEEYGKETGMGVKDAEYTISTETEKYLGTKVFSIYLDFTESVYMNSSERSRLSDSLNDNVQIVNGYLSNVVVNLSNNYSYDNDPDIIISIYSDGSGKDMEFTIPVQTVFLPYNENVYLDCYNKTPSEILVIKPDLMYSNYQNGLDIYSVYGINSHEYLVFDSSNNQILLVDSDSGSVTGECSYNNIYDFESASYSATDNKLFIIESYSSSYKILDLETMTLTSATLPGSTGYECQIDIDEGSRRIYILTYSNYLYIMDMDNYSVCIKNEFLSGVKKIVVDEANDLLYTAKSDSLSRYDVSSDSLVLGITNAGTAYSGYYSGLKINADGSALFFDCSSGIYKVNTADLSETSMAVVGNLISVSDDGQYLVTYDSDYPDYTFFKYDLNSETLINTVNLYYIDGYAVNPSGSEILYYNYSYYTYTDIIDYRNL